MVRGLKSCALRKGKVGKVSLVLLGQVSIVDLTDAHTILNLFYCSTNSVVLFLISKSHTMLKLRAQRFSDVSPTASFEPL